MAVKEKIGAGYVSDGVDSGRAPTALAARGETVMTETAPVSETGMIRRALSEDVKRRNKLGAGAVLRGTALFGGGFFLSFCPMPFGSYPLGIAFLSAVSGVSDVVITLIGTMMGSFFITGAEYPGAAVFASVAMSAALVFARLGYGFLLSRRGSDKTVRMLTEPLNIRLLTGAVTLLGLALIRFLTDGASALGFHALVFTVSFGVSASYLYASLFDFGRRYGKLYEAGIAFTAFTVASALSVPSVFGCSVSVFLSPVFVAFAGAAGGQTRGGFLGAVAGCAMYLGHASAFGEETGLGAILLLSAFGYTAGLFRELGGAVGSTVPAVVGAGISVCVFEKSYVLSAAMCVSASLAAAALRNAVDAAGKRIFNDGGNGSDYTDYINDMMTRRRERDMKKLTRAFSSLSEIFSNLSVSLRRPDRGGVRSVCGDVAGKYCSSCERRDDCAACEGGVGSEKLIDRLADGVRVGENDRFFSECPFGERISKELNDRISLMFEEAMKNDRAGLFSSEYASVSKLLSATSPVGEEYRRDRLLSERLTKAFTGKEFFADVIAVCGKRRKAVIAGGADISRSMMGASQIRGLCERVCGVSFSEPEFAAADRNMVMLLEQRRVYNVVATRREKKKKGEKICGDSSLMFYGDDRFYSVICDGMGSGSEAAVVSRICLTFTEKMLSGGNSTDITLSMLNNFVRSKAEECPSAMDILSIDLLNGDGIFTKCGAAASYVLRKNRIFKITSKTPPVGIMEEQRRDSVDFEFRAGDVFLMISDGILCETMSDDEFDRSMGELMRYSDGDTSESVADRILEFAEATTVRQDDMTVIVGRVGINPEK